MNHGSFSGEPIARWRTERGPDRQMEMYEDFSFTDPKGKVWSTPADYEVNGASIPRPLWSLVGSPFTGDYRRASIVHDKACDEVVGDPAGRRAADRMFFHACRAGGCSTKEATLLYLGVRIGALTNFVPVWAATSTIATGPRIAMTSEDRRLEADFRLAAEALLRMPETDDPEQLEARTDAVLEQVAAGRVPQ